MAAARSVLIAMLTLAHAGVQSPPTSARPVKATFMGVATILLDDGETAIMTDGFFSRPSAESLKQAIAPDRLRIDSALKRSGVTRLAAIMTAHSHWDHAFDTPVVAARTGALIIGSTSTANIARGLDFPDDRIRIISGGETFTFGRFRITAIKSPHSPDPIFMGEITAPLRPPAGADAYKEGGNYSFLVEHSGRRILIHASANFAPGVMKGVNADVVYLGIGVLGKQTDRFIKDYWAAIVEATGARLVIPIHWDNFFKSLDEPLEPLPPPQDDVDRAMKALTGLAAADNVAIRMPRAFETVDLSALRP